MFDDDSRGTYVLRYLVLLSHTLYFLATVVNGPPPNDSISQFEGLQPHGIESWKFILGFPRLNPTKVCKSALHNPLFLQRTPNVIVMAGSHNLSEAGCCFKLRLRLTPFLETAVFLSCIFTFYAALRKPRPNMKVMFTKNPMFFPGFACSIATWFVSVSMLRKAQIAFHETLAIA